MDSWPSFIRCLGWAGLAAFLGVYLSVSLSSLGMAVTLGLTPLLFLNQNWRRILLQHPLFYPIIFLVAAILASMVFAKPYLFYKPLEKTLYLFAIFPFSILFLLSPLFKETIKKWCVFLALFLGALAIGQSTGLLNDWPVFFHKHLKPLPGSDFFYLATGFTFHHTPFGASLSWLFHIMMAQALFSSSSRPRKVYSLAAGFCLVGVLLTFSRGTWLSLCLSSLLCMGLVKRRQSVIFTGALFGIFCLLFVSNTDFQNRIRSFRLDSNQERLVLWELSLQMFKDSPVTGQGYHSFGERMGQFSPVLNDKPDFPKEAHSMYLDFLSTTGILGFSAFLFFLLSCLRMLSQTWKTLPPEDLDRPWILSCLGGFVSFLIAGFFDRHFFMSQTLIPVLFFLGLAASVYLKHRSNLIPRH